MAVPPNPKLLVLKHREIQSVIRETSCRTYFVCPNVGAELGVAKVFWVWPKAGGAVAAGVEKPKEKADAERNFN